MLWPIPVDTHHRSIDTMLNATQSAAHTFIGSLQTATNVSATKFCWGPEQRFSVCSSGAAGRKTTARKVRKVPLALRGLRPGMDHLKVAASACFFSCCVVDG